MNVLVTGGAGFIGSHFIKRLLELTEVEKVINLDCLSYGINSFRTFRVNLKKLSNPLKQPIKITKNYPSAENSPATKKLVFLDYNYYSYSSLIQFIYCYC